MTSQLPSLRSCAGFALCDQARALQSTAWVSWAALSVLLVGLVGVGAAEGGEGVWGRGFGAGIGGRTFGEGLGRGGGRGFRREKE